MKKSVTREVVVCDLGGCEDAAVSTCQSCKLDWCIAHGGVFEGRLLKREYQERQAGDPSQTARRTVSKITASFTLELCNPCQSRLKGVIQAKDFKA